LKPASLPSKLKTLSDEEYRQLQQDLLVQPDRGDLIKNGGGIRKYVVLKVTREKWWDTGDLLLGHRG
jgi:hypothetical protein